jgi:hypothetical protein
MIQPCRSRSRDRCGCALQHETDHLDGLLSRSSMSRSSIRPDPQRLHGGAGHPHRRRPEDAGQLGRHPGAGAATADPVLIVGEHPGHPERWGFCRYPYEQTLPRARTHGFDRARRGKTNPRRDPASRTEQDEYGAGDIRTETVPDPKLREPTDAIVRVLRSCVCGSDLWLYSSKPAQEHGDRAVPVSTVARAKPCASRRRRAPW